MKQNLIWGALFISVVLNLALLARLEGADKTPQTPAENQAHSVEHSEQVEHFELAVSMSHFQRYADKLYFAGVKQNWPLADFYLHEIEETAEEIEKAKVIDDGINVSEHIGLMLKPAIETLEKTVKSQNAPNFDKDYRLLVASCNNCHAATKHEFVQITVPEKPTYQNQRFEPVKLP